MTDLTAFDSAVNEVLGEEAGYGMNPADPGGETKWGISKRAFPNVDIVNLTRDDAKQLYLAHYWQPLEKYGLTGKFMLVAFECAVNQGLAYAEIHLAPAKGQLSWFQASRALGYTKDKNFAIFGDGWFRRLFKEME
jgi:lysozyme family protein